MGDRRPTRGLNPRVRKAVGVRRERPERDDELAQLMESGDFSPETMERVAELLGQVDPRRFSRN